MPNSVLAQVVRFNSFDYECIHQMSILCDNAQVEGIYWRIPTISGGVHTGYVYRKSDSKPTPDSVKTIRVQDRNENRTYYIAIADGADASVFTDACNACCDTVEPLPTVALPTILVEEQGCQNEEGNYEYFAYTTTPPPAGTVYRLAGSVNGAALPAAPATGFASLAALETWADANWNTGGLTGVTLDGGKVTLNAGATGATGAISVIISKYFDSNVPGALTAGQNYVLDATINGNVLPSLEGVDDAALSTVVTAANADATYASYGVWSESAGAIRLVETTKALASATLVVTKV